METLVQFHEELAVFLARIFLGIIFFFQGYDAVFNVKIKNIITTYESTFKDNGIPRFLTVLGAWFTSITELIGGLLLILGLFEYYALFLLGLTILIASIAFSINIPMWDMKYVFPRFLLILFLLIVPPNWNLWTIEHLIFGFTK